MTWPELYKAKRIAEEISNDIEKLIKEHNDLMKDEIASHGEKLAEEVGEAARRIEDQYKELVSDIRSHGKQVKAKSKFLRRHNSRSFK